MNKIFVVDAIWVGHVPTFHKCYLKALLNLGYEVVSVSPNPSEVSDWLDKNFHDVRGNANCVFIGGAAEMEYAKGFDSKITLVSILVKLNLYRLAKPVQLFLSGINIWKRTSGIIKDYIKVNKSESSVLVFFPYLDYLFYHKYFTATLVDYLFPYNWSGLYLQPTDLRLKRGHKHLYTNSIFNSQNCRGICVLDENIITDFQAIIGNKIIRFPDVTDDSDGPTTPVCLEIVKKAKGRKVLTLIGAISKRKNLLLTLEAAQVSYEQNLPYYFVIAGPILDLNDFDEGEKDYIKSFYESKPDNVYFHLKYIPDGLEYNSFIKISDLIFAMYDSFYHSSNTLTKAAIFEKFTIVSEGYLMAERIYKYQTGLAVSPKDGVLGLLRAIECLIKGLDYNGLKLIPKFKKYSEMHSQAYLNKAFSETLNL